MVRFVSTSRSIHQVCQPAYVMRNAKKMIYIYTKTTVIYIYIYIKLCQGWMQDNISTFGDCGLIFKVTVICTRFLASPENLEFWVQSWKVLNFAVWLEKFWMLVQPWKMLIYYSYSELSFNVPNWIPKTCEMIITWALFFSN